MPRPLPIAPMLALPLLLMAAGAGCSSTPKSPEFAVAPGQYALAFEAVRDTLAASNFQVDRVDAAAGVITSVPKTSAGLATPWDEEQTTFGQEWEDLINDQQRRVRITFEPAMPAQAGSPIDLRQYDGPMTGNVQVTIDRVQHTGWRLETSALRYSTFTQDPALTERAMWPSYVVPFSQDPLFEGRLAEAIRKRLARSPAPESPKAPETSPSEPAPVTPRG